MIAMRAMRDNGEPVGSLQGKIAARGGRAKLGPNGQTSPGLMLRSRATARRLEA
jgi:hypothetical protein